MTLDIEKLARECAIGLVKFFSMNRNLYKDIQPHIQSAIEKAIAQSGVEMKEERFLLTEIERTARDFRSDWESEDRLESWMAMSKALNEYDHYRIRKEPTAPDTQEEK